MGTGIQAVIDRRGTGHAIKAVSDVQGRPALGQESIHPERLERNLRRLEELRPRLRHNPALAEQLEESITTIQRLLDTERWLEQRKPAFW
jgi:hypothetical protein